MFGILAFMFACLGVLIIPKKIQTWAVMCVMYAAFALLVVIAIGMVQKESGPRPITYNDSTLNELVELIVPDTSFFFYYTDDLEPGIQGRAMLWVYTNGEIYRLEVYIRNGLQGAEWYRVVAHELFHIRDMRDGVMDYREASIEFQTYLFYLDYKPEVADYMLYFNQMRSDTDAYKW